MKNEDMLTDKEREFLISLILNLPIKVTLATINENETISMMTTLVKKLSVKKLKSDGADDTIRDREE